LLPLQYSRIVWPPRLSRLLIAEEVTDATGGQSKAAGYPRINGSTKARRARIHPSQIALSLPFAIEIES
jgi:hypothetical protein